MRLRHLVLVLGDQLSLRSAAFEGFDPSRDRVLMVEAPAESTHVPSTKMRSALFLSAMRHFAEALRAQAWPLDYLTLGRHAFETIADALSDALTRHAPDALVLVEPGEWRLEQAVLSTCKAAGVRVDLRDELHFLCARRDFIDDARGKPRLVMEAFYRRMRVRHRVLMQPGGEPVGGQWNFDPENRGTFGRQGPGLLPGHRRSRRTPSRARRSPMWSSTSATTMDASRASTGRSRGTRRWRRCRTSSRTGCRTSAASRMRCGRTNPSCTTR